MLSNEKPLTRTLKNECIVTNKTDKTVLYRYIFPHPGPGVVYQPMSESGCNLLGSALGAGGLRPSRCSLAGPVLASI